MPKFVKVVWQPKSGGVVSRSLDMRTDLRDQRSDVWERGGGKRQGDYGREKGGWEEGDLLERVAWREM